MSEEKIVQIVAWCRNCGHIFVTGDTQESCESCDGELKEIGWVEE